MRPSSSSSSSSSSGSVPLTRINSPRRQMILPPPSPPPVSDSIRFPILRPLHHLPSYDFIMMESNRQDVLILFCINDNKSSCSLKKPPSRSVSLLGHPFVHENDLDTSKFIIWNLVFFFKCNRLWCILCFVSTVCLSYTDCLCMLSTGFGFLRMNPDVPVMHFQNRATAR